MESAATKLVMWDPERYINNPSVIRGLSPSSHTGPSRGTSFLKQECGSDSSPSFSKQNQKTTEATERRRWEDAKSLLGSAAVEPDPSNMAEPGWLHYLGISRGGISQLRFSIRFLYIINDTKNTLKRLCRFITYLLRFGTTPVDRFILNKNIIRSRTHPCQSGSIRSPVAFFFFLQECVQEQDGREKRNTKEII